MRLLNHPVSPVRPRGFDPDAASLDTRLDGRRWTWPGQMHFFRMFDGWTWDDLETLMISKVKLTSLLSEKVDSFSAPSAMQRKSGVMGCSMVELPRSSGLERP